MMAQQNWICPWQMEFTGHDITYLKDILRLVNLEVFNTFDQMFTFLSIQPRMDVFI